jgi:hypothetical protein
MLNLGWGMKRQLSNREWLSLFLIGLSSLVSILPGAYYFVYGYIPGFWLGEGGLYETTGATACFIAGLLNLASFRELSNQKQYLGGFWMLLLAVGCIFIAGEEISWGQNIFDFYVPESITATNFQKEFNLHNSMLIQSSNNSLSSIFSKLLMLYFIVLPMFLVVFPTIEKWIKRLMIPIPSMLIAIIALLAKVADVANHKIVYGSSFKEDKLHFGEGVESLFELCLLILAIECFYSARRKRIV